MTDKNENKKDQTPKQKMVSEEECNKRITKALEKYRADQFTYSMKLGFLSQLHEPYFDLNIRGGTPEELSELANKLSQVILSYAKKHPMKTAKEIPLVASSD